MPRMRTASGILALIREADPGTEVTEYHIRRLMKSGAVHLACSGRKQLADADAVIALLASGQEKAPCAYLAKSAAQRTETPQTTRKGLRLS